MGGHLLTLHRPSEHLVLSSDRIPQEPLSQKGRIFCTWPFAHLTPPVAMGSGNLHICQLFLCLSVFFFFFLPLNPSPVRADEASGRHSVPRQVRGFLWVGVEIFLFV